MCNNDARGLHANRDMYTLTNCGKTYYLVNTLIPFSILSNYTKPEYRQVSNISLTLVGNKIVNHSDVVGASPASYIFILDLTPGFIGLGQDNRKPRQETFKFGDLVRLILEILR